MNLTFAGSASFTVRFNCLRTTLLVFGISCCSLKCPVQVEAFRPWRRSIQMAPFLQDWNAENPNIPIHVYDRILMVNRQRSPGALGSRWENDIGFWWFCHGFCMVMDGFRMVFVSIMILE